MDKFAIDLDKVLDDFEINEDREERLAAGKVPFRTNFSLPKPSSNVLNNETPSHVIPLPKFESDEHMLSQVLNESIKNNNAENLCEDGQPDLLGSVKPPQNYFQQQGSEENGESEGSLPDVTVLSRPSNTRSLDYAEVSTDISVDISKQVDDVNIDLVVPNFAPNPETFTNLTMEQHELAVESVKCQEILPNIENAEECSNAVASLESISLNAKKEAEETHASSTNSVVIVPNATINVENECTLALQDKLQSYVEMQAKVEAAVVEEEEVMLNANEIQEDTKPVSFTSAQELSDTELERMLDELEEEESLLIPSETLEQIVNQQQNQEAVASNVVATETWHEGSASANNTLVDQQLDVNEPLEETATTQTETIAHTHHLNDLVQPRELSREASASMDQEAVSEATADTNIIAAVADPHEELQGNMAQSNQEDEARPHRPNSLELPSKETIPYPPGSTVTVGPPGNTPGSNVPAASGMSYTIPDEPATPAEPYEGSPSASSSSSTSSCGAEEASALEESRPASLLQSLGVVPPYWVPDAEAPVCMHCEAKFTVIKRRHHCRACGKVLCSRCCGHKARLQYLENTEARVCQSCYPILCAAQDDDSGSANNSPQRLGRSPNPNNPMEYCSTIPPLQQAGGSRNQRPPSVMVPVGVLKREGRTRGEPKQVMFSDGIRPGGDLTELDGWAESRVPRRQGRQARRLATPPGPLPSLASSTVQGLRLAEVTEYRPTLHLTSNLTALVPSDLASYTLLADSTPGAFSFDLSADMSNLMDTLRNENEPPVVFALNKNLFVLVKIITLSCCVHKTVWCFTTRGLRCEGQDEMVFILEALPDEKSVPRDVFAHISAVYVEAGKGNTVTELGHTTFHGPFLGSSEHGGFLYIRPTSQCLQRLILPPPPYLVAVLLQRWEAPWARLFPLRLLLRLGYEFRYYPCPLVSVRQRTPVYCELGQTILDLLADFRNFTYTLPCMQGLVIQMENSQTSLLIPRNRYDQVVRVLNNSNDHVLALGGSFSRDVDSHLVCVQADDESYHSKAISIQNIPRKVTGASFLIFNGALKSSSGLSAKSSIVEDGLMVQVSADTMQALRTALREMKDFSVGCGPTSVQPPTETVLIKWVEDDRYFNVGVRSQIDGCKLDGVPSIRVHNGTDYRGENCFIRWTEVFLLKCEEGGGRVGAELDMSRVAESISRAFCVALVPLLDLLATAGLLILAVRVTLDPDNVGYEAGSSGEKLPPLYMRSLDDELVPVIHQAASQSSEGKTVVELVFSVMRH